MTVRSHSELVKSRWGAPGRVVEAGARLCRHFDFVFRLHSRGAVFKRVHFQIFIVIIAKSGHVERILDSDDDIFNLVCKEIIASRALQLHPLRLRRSAPRRTLFWPNSCVGFAHKRWLRLEFQVEFPSQKIVPEFFWWEIQTERSPNSGS